MRAGLFGKGFEENLEARSGERDRETRVIGEKKLTENQLKNWKVLGTQLNKIAVLFLESNLGILFFYILNCFFLIM